MQPGRELDKLVAEKIFSAKVDWYDEAGKCNTDSDMDFARLKFYSRDIEAAWEVFEYFPYNQVELIKAMHEYWCIFRSLRDDNDEEIAELGVSAPHAICLAALKTVGVSIPE